MKRPAVPIVVITVAAALFGLLVYGIAAGGNDTTLDDAVKRGDRPTAPGATLDRKKVDGSGTLKLADLRGQIVVLNFWGSWCEPCKDEAPVLRRMHDRLADAGKGTVLGATYNDATTDSIAFERENDIRYPSVQDVVDRSLRQVRWHGRARDVRDRSARPDHRDLPRPSQ